MKRTASKNSRAIQRLDGGSQRTQQEKHHDASMGNCWSIVVTLALAPISADAQQIFACVNNNSGAVRIVAQAAACRTPESLVTWNVVGPQGPPGPAGPAGALGWSPGPSRTRRCARTSWSPGPSRTRRGARTSWSPGPSRSSGAARPERRSRAGKRSALRRRVWRRRRVQ